MRLRRNAPLPDDVCLCVPEIGFRCVWCERREQKAKTQVESVVEETGFPAERPPWDVNDLPPHLRGLGYRGADQDGFDGSEWVSPLEHHAGDLIEAARELLDAIEV
jgi:hypothetical protein